MKFPKLKAVPITESELPIEKLCLSTAKKGKKVFLSECKNLNLEDGILKGRDGLEAFEGFPHLELDRYDYLYEPFRFTETQFETGGSKYTVAFYGITDNESRVDIYVYLIGARVKFPTDSITFHRVSSEEFYMPQKIKFFTGKATNGCGLYMFTELVNEMTSEKYDAVFELSQNLTEWDRIYDFYCPVIYINGRGNLYDEIGDIVYQDKPVELEQLNLIESRFKAYFTSDGHSSSFQLPISSLDDNNFICRVYRSPGNFTQWTVMGGSDTASATFNSVEVTLKVNRATGTFEFLKSGTAFAMDRMTQFRSNNIEVLAYKTVAGGRRAVFATEKCFCHNSHIYFYGDIDNQNKIFAARSEKPLYFPKDSVAEVGNDNKIVKTIAASKDRLLAFKNDGVYDINVTLGRSYTSNELLIGVGEQFYKNDTFKCKRISSFGCEYSNCVCASGDQLFWQGGGKQIYSYNNGNIKCVSEDIENCLSGINIGECYSLILVPYKNGIIVFNNTKAFVMQYVDNMPCWFYWEFPQNLKIDSVALIEGELRFLISENRKKVYLAKLSGYRDITGYTDSTWQYKNIDLNFKTNYVLFNNILKPNNVLGVGVRAKLEGDVDISFYNEKDSLCSKIKVENINTADNFHTFGFRSNIRRALGLSLEMTAQAPFEISNISYKYH